MSRFRLALFAILTFLLATGPVAGQVVVPADASPGAAGPERPAVNRSPVGQPAPVGVSTTQQVTSGQTQLSTPSETFRIRLFPDGNARWTVTANFTLSSESETAAFEQLAADFEAGRTEADLGLDAFRQASELASSSTGRSMSITRVQRDHAVYNGTGQLVLRFTWTNFSRQSGDQLYVDDVFNTTGGTWFPALATDQALVIVPPGAYQIVEAEPQGYGLTSGALRWDGYQEFRRGDLQATYRRVSRTSTVSPNGNGTGPPNDGSVPLLAILAVVGIGAVAVVAYLISTREGGIPAPGAETDDDEDGVAAERSEPSAAEPEQSGAGAGAEQGVDEELLSDEERIERLLEQNGGRMKQATIVKETDWSNAKVSQLLSAMDDEGRIDKLRLGRENLISFPDEDVTDLDDEP